MDRKVLIDLLKLVNNSTSNSLDLAQREVYYKERKRLAALLRQEVAQKIETN